MAATSDSKAWELRNLINLYYHDKPLIRGPDACSR